jgi:hypothetical protein
MEPSVVPSGTARLRRKNQLTVPDDALRAVGASVGDRFLVTVQSGAIRLVPVRDSYAGTMADVFPAEAGAAIRKERDAWGG